MLQGSELDLAVAAAVSEHSAAVCGGLAAVLGGRVGAAQRQEALELTAALARVVGTDWILGGSQVGSGLQFGLGYQVQCGRYSAGADCQVQCRDCQAGLFARGDISREKQRPVWKVLT